jgi:hypothetical protein
MLPAFSLVLSCSKTSRVLLYAVLNTHTQEFLLFKNVKLNELQVEPVTASGTAGVTTLTGRAPGGASFWGLSLQFMIASASGDTITVQPASGINFFARGQCASGTESLSSSCQWLSSPLVLQWG